jgi:hypothetical protein
MGLWNNRLIISTKSFEAFIFQNKQEGIAIPTKFVESTSKNELLNVFSTCLNPYNVSKSIITSNLEHALHGFEQEMKTPFEKFINSSPKDMKQVFYQILLKHFLISINSDSKLLERKEFPKITNEIENLIE